MAVPFWVLPETPHSMLIIMHVTGVVSSLSVSHEQYPKEDFSNTPVSRCQPPPRFPRTRMLRVDLTERGL